VRHSFVSFFGLVVALAVPFWVIGSMVTTQILPGLPIAALVTFCPALAALILVDREDGAAGVKRLLMRAVDYRRIPSKAWYAPIVLLPPAVSVLSFFVQRLMGTPVPPPHLEPLRVGVLSVAFFVCALGEELGWSGYVIEPMRDRWGARTASVVLGCFWAVYHYVALAEAHRSIPWVAWWTLGTIAARVIMVQIYESAGRSVVAMALFHASSNVAWQTFPIHGSYFEPRVSGVITAIVAAVVVVWRRP